MVSLRKIDILSILFTLVVICPLSSQQRELTEALSWANDIGDPLVESDGSYSDYTSEPDESLFKWAWDMTPYPERYPHLKGRPWLDPSGVFEAILFFEFHRENDNQTHRGLSGLTSFRPFVLDFNTWSIAMGVSFSGKLGTVDDTLKVINVDFAGVDVAETRSQGGQTHLVQAYLNFSTLTSFPELGLQFMLEIGYGWSQFRHGIDNINADLLDGGLIGNYDNFQYKQNDWRFFTAFNILKSFDRDYFNFVRLFFYVSLIVDEQVEESQATLTSDALGNVEQNGKRDLPFDDDANGFPFIDPNVEGEFDLDIYFASAEVRLFTIMTPLLKHRGISFSAYGGAYHYTGHSLVEEHYGLNTKFGGIVSLFDGITFRVNFIWKRGNDQVDGFEYVMGVRASGILREVYKVITSGRPPQEEPVDPVEEKVAELEWYDTL